jgi:hypothetical protein
MMFIKKPKTSRILAMLRALAKQKNATAYTISKSSGMPVANIHRMLNNHISIPIRNLEMLIDALGLTVQILPRKGSAGRPAARTPGKRSPAKRGSAKRRTR